MVRKFLICIILLFAIALIIGAVLPMSVVWGIVFSLIILTTIFFLKLKGGNKWETRTK
jgi:accessory gene regulator protein AgrB